MSEDPCRLSNMEAKLDHIIRLLAHLTTDMNDKQKYTHELGEAMLEIWQRREAVAQGARDDSLYPYTREEAEAIYELNPDRKLTR